MPVTSDRPVTTANVSSLRSSYRRGLVVRVSVEFDAEDVPTDPQTVLFLLTKPDESLVTYEYGAADGVLVRESAGVYHVDIETDQNGIWLYRFESSGLNEAAGEGEFVTTGDITRPSTGINANQRQYITIPPGGGTYSLTFGGLTTTNLAHSASAAAVQAALEVLANIAPGDVVVSGSDGGPFTCDFLQPSGAYRTGICPLIHLNTSGIVAVGAAAVSIAVTISATGVVPAPIYDRWSMDYGIPRGTTGGGRSNTTGLGGINQVIPGGGGTTFGDPGMTAGVSYDVPWSVVDEGYGDTRMSVQTVMTAPGPGKATCLEDGIYELYSGTDWNAPITGDNGSREVKVSVIKLDASEPTYMADTCGSASQDGYSSYYSGPVKILNGEIVHTTAHNDDTTANDDLDRGDRCLQDLSQTRLQICRLGDLTSAVFARLGLSANLTVTPANTEVLVPWTTVDESAGSPPYTLAGGTITFTGDGFWELFGGMNWNNACDDKSRELIVYLHRAAGGTDVVVAGATATQVTAAFQNTNPGNRSWRTGPIQVFAGDQVYCNARAKSLNTRTLRDVRQTFITLKYLGNDSLSPVYSRFGVSGVVSWAGGHSTGDDLTTPWATVDESHGSPALAINPDGTILVNETAIYDAVCMVEFNLDADTGFKNTRMTGDGDLALGILCGSETGTGTGRGLAVASSGPFWYPAGYALQTQHITGVTGSEQILDTRATFLTIRKLGPAT